MFRSLVSTYSRGSTIPFTSTIYTLPPRNDLELITSSSFDYTTSPIDWYRITDCTSFPTVSQHSAVVSSLKKVANAAPTAVNALGICAKANANASHQIGEQIWEDVKIGNNMDQGYQVGREGVRHACCRALCLHALTSCGTGRAIFLRPHLYIDLGASRCCVFRFS